MLSRKKSLISLISLMLAAVLFLSSCVGGVNTAAVKGTRENSGGTSVRTLKDRASEKIAGSETSELWFDKKTGAVTFYDRTGGRNWNSLPSFDNNSAASLYVKVFDGESFVVLDSQRNCADNNGIKYEKTASGVKVTYTFTDGRIKVVLPVSYTLNGAYFEFYTDISEASVSEGTEIISVCVLPFMGAVKYTEGEYDMSVFADWFLVPDGPGALMYTAAEDENISSYTFSVYGKEYYEENTPSTIGAFGIKQKDSALAVTVTKGDENALIRILRSNADSEKANRIYPEFIITPTDGDTGRVRFGEKYNGEIKVRYEALSGEGADYIGVATSVRQALTAEGFLSDGGAEAEYPLFISAPVSVPSDSNDAVTSFPQAENLLTLLKGKGVNDIKLSLDGMLTESGNISSSAGGEKEFNSLLSYALSQQLGVFAGIRMFSSEDPFGSEGVDGKRNSYFYNNPLYPYVGKEGSEMTYFTKSAAEKEAGDVLKTLRDYSCGISVSDSGNVFGDFSRGVGYSEMTDAVKKVLSGVGVNKTLMLSSADINKVKYADYIRNVPLYTVHEQSGSYLAVPFVPAVLHSSVIYAGEPANLYTYPILSLLKAVEFGAVPHFMWCFEQNSDKYYENTLNEGAEFYLRAKKELSSLSDLRIIAHYQYSDGVFCTEYESGAKVYVNYNNFSVIIGNVAVMPYNFLRIG
ncbi:MAG: hypothetical protein IJA39_01750 [Clostridia bacterium]|nr:hypothetical protein [Clostridia bacterium]